jgi:hypothetical protein
MRKQQRVARLLVPVLTLLALACGPCSVLTSERPTPPHALPVSTEAAGQLESRIRQNLKGEPGSQFILRSTDAEVTSFAATELSKYDESPIVDPQIWFTRGNVYATGTLVNVVPVETDFLVIASARVANGQIVVEVKESSAGAIPIPNPVLEWISESLSETLDELQLDVEVTALEILEGEVIIKGTRE